MEDSTNQNAPVAEGSQQPVATPQPPVNAAPEKKKHSVVKIVALVIGGFLVVGALLFAGIFFLASNLTKEVSNNSKAFISAMAAGDYNTAYGYFSPELQEVQSQMEFESQASTLSLTKDCSLKVESANASTENGTSTGKVEGTVNCPSASYKTNIEYLKQGDSYKIVKYSIEP